MSRQPIIDQTNPFNWVEDLPHLKSLYGLDADLIPAGEMPNLQNLYCMDADSGVNQHLKELVSAKEEHIGYLHDKLDYNRRFRRLWRFTAIVAFIALGVALYHSWGVANCVSL